MDIQVTFPDGHAEERPDTCPVLWFDRWITEAGKVAAIQRAERGETMKLGGVRGFAGIQCYRLTGDAPLTGEWQLARVETVEEQIARLTRERDEERARIARVRTFTFCEGALEVRRSETTGLWFHEGRPFPGAYDLTLDEALARAERWERDLGYHLPAEEVLRRCKLAVKAAGWEACPETSDERRTVWRPDPNKVTNTWVEFPRKRDEGAAELRFMAATAVNRLQGFGIAVDLTGK